MLPTGAQGQSGDLEQPVSLREEDLKNEFRPVSIERALKRCPLAPMRLDVDYRNCTARIIVFVPCFAQARTVIHTLRSIWAQACAKHVVVVDDDPEGGHTCGMHIQSDPEVAANSVEIIMNPYNLGLAGVRNFGLSVASKRGCASLHESTNPSRFDRAALSVPAPSASAPPSPTRQCAAQSGTTSCPSSTRTICMASATSTPRPR